jgi:hypothetical protein
LMKEYSEIAVGTLNALRVAKLNPGSVTGVFFPTWALWDVGDSCAQH